MRIRLFPFDKELEKKWWHRLSKVVILFAAGFSILLSIVITYIAIHGERIRHDVYDFERGYSTAKGSEEVLDRWNTSYDYLDRFIAASKDRDPSDRVWVPKENLEETIEQWKGTGLYRKSDWEIEDMIFNALASKNAEGERVERKLKIWYDYSYFPELLLLLLGPITYAIFIGAYAVLLYIIKGGNQIRI